MKDAEQMVPRTRQALDEAVIALEDLVVRLHPSSASFPRKAHMTCSTDLQTALASESEVASSDEYKTASQQLETVKSGQQAA